jgi:lysophospholipase L1-like esterase
MRFGRLARLPLLVLVYVLVAEAGLQIAAFFVQRATRAEMPVAWVTGNLRVLCLGDSNTYGVWLDERGQAYPQQLETVWNERIESPKLEVLNLGVPGTNSSRLVRELPQMLATFSPDILIIMVGVNDFWTQPVPLEDEDAQATQPTASFLKRHSVLYRLYFLFQRGRIASAPEFLRDPNSSLEGRGRHRVRVGDQEFEMGFAAAGPGFEGDGEGLARNLLRIAELAREAGASLYLMTYPAQRNYYVFANEVITAFAAKSGTPLIDLTAAFASICPRNDCPDKMFPDGHPNAKGYRLVAETILARLSPRGAS